MKKMMVLAGLMTGTVGAVEFTSVGGALYASDKDYAWAAAPGIYAPLAGEVLTLGQRTLASSTLSCTTIRNMGVQGDSLILRYDVIRGTLDRQIDAIVFGDKTPMGTVAGVLSGCAVLNPDRASSYTVFVPKGTAVSLPTYFSDYVASFTVDGNLKMSVTLTKK